jgi:hypothetical protein
MSHTAPVPLDPTEFPRLTLVRPSDPTIRLCRRQARRLPALPGARAEVRPWNRSTADMAVELLDISEIGMRVRLRVPVMSRDLVEVVLRDPAGEVCARVFAAVRWWSEGRDGTAVAGFEFGSALESAVVERLGEVPGGASTSE